MRTDSPEKATVSIDEAARVLGIGRGLAYAMAKEGKIPVLQLGRRILVPRAALERLLSEGDRGAPYRDTEEVHRETANDVPIAEHSE